MYVIFKSGRKVEKKRIKLFKTTKEMRKQTEYLVIGIGIASILAGIYEAYRTG